MINDNKTKKISFYGLCLALGLVLSYAEAVIPINIGIPGAKLGLPNIVTVLLMYSAGNAAAFTIGLLRIVLSGFMFGDLFAIAYSAAGLCASFAAMALLKKSGGFGMIGVSTAGGVMHNIGQIAIAVLLTNGSVLSYLPVLLAAGIIAGIVIGILSGILNKRLSAFLKKLS